MKLLELFSLFEDKAELIAKNQGQKILAAAKNHGEQLSTPEEIIEVLKNADPSRNQQYLQWIVNRYVAGEFRLEDVNRIKVDLQAFERHKKKLEKKDINQYKSLNDLYDVVDPLDDADRGDDEPMSNKQAKKSAYAAKRDEFISSGQADIIHKDGQGILVNPKTEEAAKFFGMGTRWCTAAENNNMFSYYHKEGPLYTWLGSDGFKAQFHLETDQWMDDKDVPLTDEQLERLVKIPAIKELYDKGIIKKEEQLVGKDFDKYYNNRMSTDEWDEGYQDWERYREKIEAYISKHGLTDKLMSKLYNADVLLPMWVISGTKKLRHSSKIDKYFQLLSMKTAPNTYMNKDYKDSYELEVLSKLTDYMNKTHSDSNVLQQTAYQLIQKIINTDTYYAAIGNYIKSVGSDNLTKRQLLQGSSLPLAIKYGAEFESSWPELRQAIEDRVKSASTPEEANNALVLASDLMMNAKSTDFSSVYKWITQLMEIPEVSRLIKQHDAQNKK